MGLGAKLKQLLDERNITVKDFANQIDVPPTTLYSFIKRDSENTKMDLLIKICKGLNISIKDFMSCNIKNDTENINICYDLTDFNGENIGEAINFLKANFNSPKIINQFIDERNSDKVFKKLLEEILLEENTSKSEYHEIVGKLIATDEKEIKLLYNYRKLNNNGKKEAVKRIEELSEINKYTSQDNKQSPNNTSNKP